MKLCANKENDVLESVYDTIVIESVGAPGQTNDRAAVEGQDSFDELWDQIDIDNDDIQPPAAAQEARDCADTANTNLAGLLAYQPKRKRTDGSSSSRSDIKKSKSSARESSVSDISEENTSDEENTSTSTGTEHNSFDEKEECVSNENDGVPSALAVAVDIFDIAIDFVDSVILAPFKAKQTDEELYDNARHDVLDSLGDVVESGVFSLSQSYSEADKGSSKEDSETSDDMTNSLEEDTNTYQLPHFEAVEAYLVDSDSTYGGLPVSKRSCSLGALFLVVLISFMAVLMGALAGKRNNSRLGSSELNVTGTGSSNLNATGFVPTLSPSSPPSEVQTVLPSSRSMDISMMPSLIPSDLPSLIPSDLPSGLES